jgi:hypothetical protein
MAHEAARVQLRLRGQRFEAQREVLVLNATFFNEFFAGRIHAHPEESERGTDGPVTSERHGVTFTYERRRPEQVASAGSTSGLAPSTARDVFDFGAMSNEHFGAVIASLRKGKPTFRWQELGFEQQKTLAQHVRFFGIRMLESVCREPTAPPPPMRGDDDDDLELPECGCMYCGTTEHATEKCPRHDNLMLAAQTLAIADAASRGDAPPAGCEMALARAVREAAERSAEEEAAFHAREAAELEAIKAAEVCGRPMGD